MIPLSKPSTGLREALAASKVILSGNLVQGKYCSKLEQLICDYTGSKYCAVVSSGTAALHLSLLSIGIGKGDYVIIPDYTFPATANAVLLTGAQIILSDVDHNGLITKSSIEKIANNPLYKGKIKAIIPVHQYGKAAPIDEILSTCIKNNWGIIEDAACSLGTSYKGKHTGTLGRTGCFSFHPRKIVTSGEGGAVITNERSIYDQVIMLRNHGMSTANTLNFSVPGYNYRLNDIGAAIAIPQLKKIDKTISKRKIIASIYKENLDNIKGIDIPELQSSSNIQTYLIKAKNNETRNSLSDFLKTNGVGVSIGSHALHTYDAYKDCIKSEPLKNSKTLYECGLAIPMHEGLSKYDAIKVIKLIDSFFEKEGQRKSP